MSEIVKNDRVNGIRVTRETRVTERGEIVRVYRKELRFPGGEYFARHEAELLAAHADCEALPILHAAGDGWIETRDCGLSLSRLRGLRAVTAEGILLDHPFQDTSALIRLAVHALRACALLAEHAICDVDRGLRNFCVQLGQDGEILLPTLRAIDFTFGSSRRVPLLKPPYIDTGHDEVLRTMAPACRAAIDASWRACARAIGETESRYALFSAEGRAAYERYESRGLAITRVPAGAMAFSLGRQLGEIGRAKPLRIDERHEELLSVLRAMTQRSLIGLWLFPWDRFLARLEGLDDSSRALPRVMADLEPSALQEPYDPTPINGEPAADHDEHGIEVNALASPVEVVAAGGNARPSVLQLLKSLAVRPAAYAAALLFAGAAIWQTATRTQEGEAPRQAATGPVVQAPEHHVIAQAAKPPPRPAEAPVHATTPAPQRSQPSAVPTKPKALPPARPAVPERNPSPQSPVGSALAAVRQFKADARAQVVSALAPARARAEASAVRAVSVEGLSLEKLAAQLARIGSASRKEIEDLVPQLKALAESGHAEARLWLAHLNAEGLGMARNVGAALEDYAAAARQAAPRLRDEALRRGGQLAAAMLQSEEAQLRGLALKYFETVSAIDPAALTWLGYAHELGLGVAANPSAARDWYRRAAEAPASADARGYARARLAALAP